VGKIEATRKQLGFPESAVHGGLMPITDWGGGCCDFVSAIGGRFLARQEIENDRPAAASDEISPTLTGTGLAHTAACPCAQRWSRSV
jgi:hypothetical protein